MIVGRTGFHSISTKLFLCKRSKKNEHRTLQRRTVSIERQTSNVEWKKKTRQAYHLEDWLLKKPNTLLFNVGRSMFSLL